MLTEMRMLIKDVGKTYLPQDEVINIEKASSIEEFHDMEDRLKSEEEKRLVVSIYNTHFIILILTGFCIVLV